MAFSGSAMSGLVSLQFCRPLPHGHNCLLQVIVIPSSFKAGRRRQKDAGYVSLFHGLLVSWSRIGSHGYCQCKEPWKTRNIRPVTTSPLGLPTPSPLRCPIQGLVSEDKGEMHLGSAANIVYPSNYLSCFFSPFFGLNLEILIAYDGNPNQAGFGENKELNR